MVDKKLYESYRSEVPTKVWNAVFISVFLTNILLQFAQQMSTSLVAKYADHLGASPSIVGIVMSMFAITAILFKFISAPAIDTFNRKYILAGAMCVLGIAFIGYAVSRSIPIIIASRLIQGIGLAFTATCCLTMAADALPPDKLGTGIGYFSLAQAASMALSPTIALKLAESIGYSYTFAVAACAMFAAVFIALKIKLVYKRTKKFKISINNMIAKEALFPAIITFCLASAYAGIGSFLIIYASKIGVGTDIGYFYTAYAVILLISRPLVGRLSDKFGHVKVLLPALFCFASAFIIISFSTKLWMFLIAAVVSAFGFGACTPLVQSLCMKLVPKERRGAGSCTSYIGTDLGSMVGPSLAGAFVTAYGYATMWRLMIMPIVVAAIVIIVFRRRITSAAENSPNNIAKEKTVSLESECLECSDTLDIKL
jgi:MFS family permease